MAPGLEATSLVAGCAGQLSGALNRLADRAGVRRSRFPRHGESHADHRTRSPRLRSLFWNGRRHYHAESLAAAKAPLDRLPGLQGHRKKASLSWAAPNERVACRPSW